MCEPKEQSRYSENAEISTKEKEYYKLIKLYARLLAPFYDTVTAILSKLRDKVVDFTNAPVESRILDVATGTGKQAFAFAKKGYDIIGIDLSKDMLKIAYRKNMYKNAEFQLADATKLPFKDNSFDVSCVSFALHDMILTIREKTLKEMRRVTKTNGTIIIVDYNLPKDKIGKFFVFNFVRLYEPYYPEFIKSDLAGLLKNTGIEIKRDIPVLLGAARIIKGTPQAASGVKNKRRENIAQKVTT